MSEVEDGMGFSGLAPTAEERRHDAYEDTRRKIARAREQQLAGAVAALREIELMPVSMVNDSESLRHSIRLMQQIAHHALLPKDGTR